MKRTIAIITALLTVACSKPAIEGGEDMLKVSVPSGTKVHMDGLKTCWDEGDAVTVFYRSDVAEEWTFKGNTGDVSGEICHEAVSRTETGKDIYVVYPYDANAVLDGSTILTTIPSMQQYRQESYGTAVLAAHNTFDILPMYYCTAIIELQYKGPAEITRIVLNGNDGENICGESSISFEGGRPVLTCGGETSLVLDCDVAVAGNETTSFYFSIAPCTFSKGLSFTVHFKNGDTHDVMVSEPVSISAGHVYTVGAGSPELPYDQKVMHLLFSDGSVRNNPFTEDIRFVCGSEIGPYYYMLEGKEYPFSMLCQTAIESGSTKQSNFRITNGGGLYIGGSAGDYITLPTVEGYRLQKVSVSVNKTSDFHISPAETPEETVTGGTCTGTDSGDFRTLYLTGTTADTVYRMYIDNQSCFRSITLYYCR